MHQVIFPANTQALLKTGIKVNKTDYVYFEAIGRINLGIMTQNVDAGGSQKPNLIALYNRKRLPDRIAHGRLYCLNGNEPNIEPVGIYNYFENSAAMFLNSKGEGDFREIRANSFIAKSDMELSFILNDSRPQDNSGSFKINIVVIPYEVHRTRNRYNQCPLYEPKDLAGYQLKSLAKDFTGMEWKISVTEKYYHGLLNHTYRGGDQEIAGCQCVYDTQGQLVTDEHVGTFDFAFGQYRNHRLLFQQLSEWQHVAWDVWPHDRYVDYFGEAFKYEPTPLKNIYF
ncbi:hypothetical protein GCM10028808_39690 [Spirosoma migulaei]